MNARANTYFLHLDYLLAHLNLKNTEAFQAPEVYKKVFAFKWLFNASSWNALPAGRQVVI